MYELGGHSLIAADAVGVLAAEFGLALRVVDLLQHPTPRALAEAMDAHERACTFRGLPDAHKGWLLAEVLVPGKKRRKMSEVVTRFFCEEDLPDDAPLPESQQM